LSRSIHTQKQQQTATRNLQKTDTDATTHFTSNHPLEHRLAAYNFYIKRMRFTLITEQARKQECNTICTIARNNGFPLQTIQNVKNKWTIKTQKNRKYSHKTQRKKWITFTYHSLLIHKVINLFKSTDLNVAFRTFNIIYNQLSDRTPQNEFNSSGLYKL